MLICVVGFLTGRCKEQTHIEVQAQKVVRFEERLFLYYSGLPHRPEARRRIQRRKPPAHPKDSNRVARERRR